MEREQVDPAISGLTLTPPPPRTTGMYEENNNTSTILVFTLDSFTDTFLKSAKHPSINSDTWLRCSVIYDVVSCYSMYYVTLSTQV